MTALAALNHVLPAAQAASPSVGRVAAEASETQTDFASFLAGKLSDVSSSLRAGESAAAAGIKGELPLQQVVETVMQAERQLHVALAMRDKVVSAYLEISRMQI